MTERMIEVPGGRLFAVDEGDGAPIVLLHAGIVDSRAWEPLVADLLAAGYRTVRYDARGFGRSETEDVAYSNRADAIAVLDAFGIRKACLVGNSRGGRIAIDTALEFPDRVAALVMVGANIAGFEPEPMERERELFDEMERLEESGDADAVADLDVAAWLVGPDQPAQRLPDELRAHVRAMARDAADPERVRGRPIPLEPPAAERLDELGMPVLAIAGALDFFGVQATAELLADSCADGRAAILPDVAHLVALETPGDVAALIDELLLRLDGFA